MNYQRFPKELTLISNKYLEFFNYNNDAIVEYNLANSENNDLVEKNFNRLSSTSTKAFISQLAVS